MLKNVKVAESLWHAYLFHKSGMMWDPVFAREVFENMVSVENRVDIRDPEKEFNVRYDGRFTVSIDDGSKYGKDYYIIKVYPCRSDGQNVMEDIVCGEAYIQHNDWEQVYRKLENNYD